MIGENVVIIGSGCAGLTAAIYAGRANLQPLLFEGEAALGQLSLTSDVENFPGFPEGVLGPELMAKLRQQADKFGCRFVPANVSRVDLFSRPFLVEAGDDHYQSQTVIVATGADPRFVGIPGEREYLGRGVSTCATCDGFFYQDQPIAVLGGGDSAMEEALYLTHFGTKVTVIHRRDSLRASKIMQERAFANRKIEFIWDTIVEEVKGEDQGVKSLVLRNLKTGGVTEYATGALFIAIGHDPNTAIFRGQLNLDEAGYVLVRHPSTETSVAGVFACGDVVDHGYRQAITAAGTGCAAAMDVERFLESLGD
jgi:thioredoxin reductase (NADPH)